MRLVWVGLVFHAVMILWLKRNGLPIHQKSVPCTVAAPPSRLLVVLMPGLRLEHLRIFYEYRTGVVGNIRQTGNKCPPIISYFSGVVDNPIFPNSVDTIFDHVSLTVYSGRDGIPFDHGFVHAHKPSYLGHRKRRADQRAELDGFFEFLRSKNNPHFEGKLGFSNSTLFLLNLSGLKQFNTSMESVRSLYFDIAQLAKSVDYRYEDVRTNVMILGDNGGPFALWGPDISSSRSILTISPSDVAPLIAGLLGTAVPSGSVGLIKPSVFEPYSRKEAEAVTCNVEQLDRLAKESVRGPLVADLRQMYGGTALVVNWFYRVARAGFWNKGALEYSSRLLYYLKCIHSLAISRLNYIALGLIIAAIASWIFLLITELASISHSHVDNCSWPFVVMHVAFGLLVLGSSTLPLVFKWPCTFYAFTMLPTILAWGGCSRIDVVVSQVLATPKKKVPIYLLYFLPVALLAEYSLRSSDFQMGSLIIGLCVLAQFPALPRFNVSPFLAKCGWFWCCFLLLGALHLPQWPTRHLRLYSFCGTVMICLSGFSTFWMKPTRDRVLAVTLALLTAVAMLIQPLSTSPQYQGHLKYLTVPMMFVPFLCLIGERNAKNRLIHLIFSIGVFIMLTSTRLEPLCYLLALMTCFLWMLMENFRLSKMLGANEMRRAVFLAVLSHTMVAVTRTLPEAYLHLGYPKMIPFFDLYRHTMMLSSIMAVYFTMLPSQSHAYSSYVIVLIGDALASLRAVAWDVDSTQLHVHGIAFALAYYLGSLFATSDLTPDIDVNDWSPPS